MKIGNELYFQLIIVFTRCISTFRDLSKCDFSEINEHYKKLSEERKNRSKEEKKAEKEKNEKIIEDMGFCVIDGHREKIGNFRYDFPWLCQACKGQKLRIFLGGDSILKKMTEMGKFGGGSKELGPFSPCSS